MGSTSRFSLRWPDLTDAPNGPAQLEQLATDADGWLCRAFPCTSSTRPTVSDGRPMIIRESDTGDVKVWDGADWVLIAPVVSGGGGGGSSAIGTVSATYTAGSSAQSIPSGVTTTIAFGTAVTTDAAVTRATSGAGHSFTLNQTRLWIITASLRFENSSTVGGRRFEIRSGGSTTLAIASVDAQDTEWSTCLAVARRLSSGTVITAHALHDAGTSVPLDPSSGNYVHIDLAGI